MEWLWRFLSLELPADPEPRWVEVHPDDQIHWDETAAWSWGKQWKRVERDYALMSASIATTTDVCKGMHIPLYMTVPPPARQITRFYGRGHRPHMYYYLGKLYCLRERLRRRMTVLALLSLIKSKRSPLLLRCVPRDVGRLICKMVLWADETVTAKEEEEKVQDNSSWIGDRQQYIYKNGVWMGDHLDCTCHPRRKPCPDTSPEMTSSTESDLEDDCDCYNYTEDREDCSGSSSE
jgi:hypothetical protein